jgi:DNA polymerase-3 subunit delta
VVQIKPPDSDRFLAKPDLAVRLVLVHGGDDGLVAERVANFVKAVIGGSDDPFAHVRLDSGDLAEDPGRLADEAHAVPLFGGRRAISIRLAGNRPIQTAVEAILANPPLDSWVIIAAGELRKGSALRKLCETHKGAAAIACYADTTRDLDRVIDEETKSAGLTISAEARTALRGLLGSDRLASRSEIRKLALYAAGQDMIAIDDVRAVIGDASVFAVDETVDALALGDADAFDRSYRRLIAAGTPGFVIAGAAIRQFDFLHRARAELDRGAAADAIVASARPPVFFKRQADVGRAIRLWPMGRIERALQQLDQAMLNSRLRGSISDEVIDQALVQIAAVAAALKRN